MSVTFKEYLTEDLEASVNRILKDQGFSPSNKKELYIDLLRGKELNPNVVAQKIIAARQGDIQKLKDTNGSKQPDVDEMRATGAMGVNGI